MISIGSVGNATLREPNSTSEGLIDNGMKKPILIHRFSGFTKNERNNRITIGRTNT